MRWHSSSFLGNAASLFAHPQHSHSMQAGRKKRMLDKKPNPFERKVTRPKYQILGKRLKGTEQNSGQLRHVASELVCTLYALYSVVDYSQPCDLEKENTTARVWKARKEHKIPWPSVWRDRSVSFYWRKDDYSFQKGTRGIFGAIHYNRPNLYLYLYL